MGESQEWLFESTFNRSVEVDETDERITSGGGALLLREADHRLGITEHLAARLDDPRRQVRCGQTRSPFSHVPPAPT